MNGILIWIRLFQGLSDVATILARRVAVEFSDSDDGPSDSEYDSDDWGEILSFKRIKFEIDNFEPQERRMPDGAGERSSSRTTAHCK